MLRIGLARFVIIGFALIEGLSAPPAHAAARCYVKWDASGANNGTSWADAYVSLEDARGPALPECSEIWVAQGTYVPATGGTFYLDNNRAFYGGFTGVETSRDERDWVAHETILSGDLNGDDGPNFANNDENACHVVIGNGTNSSAILDGFIISGGNAAGGTEYDPCAGLFNRPFGGGMYNDAGSPTVANCTFRGNTAHVGGGGMANLYGSSPTVTNCTFRDNTAVNGGGMANVYSSSPTVTNCTFSGNTATVGGGMTNAQNSSPTTVANCTFSGNTASDGGGGMENESGGMATVTNCTFHGNTSSSGGGGMDNDYNYNSVTVTNCTFIGNTSDSGGGGMSNNNSSVTVTNCTFHSNTSNSGGGGMVNADSSPTVTNCTFYGNSTVSGSGGMLNADNSNPTVTNTIFWENWVQITTIGGSTATVTYCDVQGGHLGTGNLSVDPLFVDAANGNLRLRLNSPVIDRGDTSKLPADTPDLDDDGNTTEPIPYDLDGNARVVNSIVDMGAYEYAPNLAPTDITLFGSSVAESEPAGTTVGTFTTTDPDAGDTFTYTLVSGAGDTDNASFTITGNTLQTNAEFDYETQNSYSIRVQTQDADGLVFQKAFTITVTDVAEAGNSFLLWTK